MSARKARGREAGGKTHMVVGWQAVAMGDFLESAKRKRAMQSALAPACERAEDHGRSLAHDGHFHGGHFHGGRSSRRSLFDYLLLQAQQLHGTVAAGRFGADMQVHLVNDGPVTFLLQT